MANELALWNYSEYSGTWMDPTERHENDRRMPKTNI